jgi:hypothetical protein
MTWLSTRLLVGGLGAMRAVRLVPCRHAAPCVPEVYAALLAALGLIYPLS